MKQKRHIPSKKRQTVPLTLWVRPEIKAEIQRRSDLEGPSMSKIGGELLAAMLRQDLHAQHSVLLQPIIEEAMKKEMAKYSTRLAKLLVRTAFEAGKARALIYNLLRLQPGMKSTLLHEFDDGSSKSARDNITDWEPKLETVLAEVFQEKQKP
jgi:hypothetical protein